jgi:hypothetical protein
VDGLLELPDGGQHSERGHIGAREEGARQHVVVRRVRSTAAASGGTPMRREVR